MHPCYSRYSNSCPHFQQLTPPPLQCRPPVRFNKNVPADVIHFYRESDWNHLTPPQTLEHPILRDLKLPEPAPSAMAIPHPHTPASSPFNPPLDYSTTSPLPNATHTHSRSVSLSSTCLSKQLASLLLPPQMTTPPSPPLQTLGHTESTISPLFLPFHLTLLCALAPINMPSGRLTSPEHDQAASYFKKNLTIMKLRLECDRLHKEIAYRQQFHVDALQKEALTAAHQTQVATTLLQAINSDRGDELEFVLSV